MVDRSVRFGSGETIFGPAVHLEPVLPDARPASIERNFRISAVHLHGRNLSYSIRNAAQELTLFHIFFLGPSLYSSLLDTWILRSIGLRIGLRVEWRIIVEGGGWEPNERTSHHSVMSLYIH